VLARLPRGRHWLAGVAMVLVVASLLPPVETYARRYVFVESTQFALFATVVPALLVLGAPWRLLGIPARERRPGFVRSAAGLAVFMAVAAGWRVPVVVNALARNPGLAVAEMATLGAAGSALWLELVPSPPLLPRLSLPLRAAFAAVPMWTIWAIAYVLGFSRVAWYSAFAHATGRAIGVLPDQEISVGIMLALPAFCFIPVIYVSLMRWLKELDDPDAELQAMADGEQRKPLPDGWPRPPRGWDTRSA
jgi:cytochrome c oxidase assembly factor CtaG